MSSSLPQGSKRYQQVLIALSLIAALSACAAGQDTSPPAKLAPKADGNDQKPTVAKGETVAELDKAIFQPSFGPKPGEPWENSLGMKFVPVPGTSVLLCIWETRVQDFEAFVKATSHNAGEGWRDPEFVSRGFNIDQDAVFSQTPLHPVTHVNWNDAVAFCRWLTEKERAAGKLSARQEFRLPTDDDWSRAVGLP